jgi:hypothetical protein
MIFFLFHSMIPLLEKDGLLLGYIPCMLLFLLLAFSFHVDFKRTPTAIKFLVGFVRSNCCRNFGSRSVLARASVATVNSGSFSKIILKHIAQYHFINLILFLYLFSLRSPCRVVFCST